MRTPPKRTRTSRRYGAAEFRPYVIALGQLALAWNELQDTLALLFWTAMMERPPQPGDTFSYAPVRAWHSIRSDLAQREMLREVINHSSTQWGRPRFVADVNWLLSEANRLSGARNDAIHSPLFIPRGLARQFPPSPDPVAPASYLFNPRALSLEKRENL